MKHLIITLPDTIWLVLVLGGTILSLVTLSIYHARLPFVRGIRDRELRELGIGMIADFTRAERFRLASHLISLAIGVVVSLVDLPLWIRGLSIVVGLIMINFCSVANTANAYFSWKLRSALVNRTVREKEEIP